MNTAWSEPRFKTPSTRWRVVCGLSVTMLSFSPTRAFKRVDLPTFGRPTIATKPQRPLGVSVLLTGQHHEHRGGGFLLGAAAALSLTGSDGILLSNLALDDESLRMVAAMHGRHCV